MSQTVVLGVDVGGTASRYVACDAEGQVLVRGRGPGATGHVFNPAERERLRAALVAIAGALAEAGLSPGLVTAGLTGFGATVADEVKGLFAQVLGIAADKVLVVDDMILAYAAIFAPGEGHLVSAGTGSIGLHIGTTSYVRVGGRGILVDDAGSGSWIALRAIDRMYRALDHDGSFAAVAGLAREIFAAVGGEDWHAIRQFVYAGDRGRIGTLSVAVARAAQGGDPTATALLAQAGRELALLAEALVARAGQRPIGFIGGVLGLDPVIEAEIRTALPGQDVRIVASDTALAAARMGTQAQTPRRQMLAARSSLG